MKRLTEIFPNASQSCRLLNSAILTPERKPKNAVQGILGAGNGNLRGRMNKTEAEFALILEAKKRNGEILRYEYEGITLRWAGIRYTPDFVVFVPDVEDEMGCIEPAYFKLIEVKGPFIKGKFERAIERFRHARTYWPEFSFEMHQKTKNGWKRIM